MSEYVFNSNLPPGPLIDKCAMALAAMEHAAEDLGIDCSPCTSASTRSQPHMHFSSEPSPTTDLFKAVLFLRSEILCMADTVPVPPRPSDVTEKNIHVPNSLFNFIAWVLLGDVGKSAPVTLERLEVESKSDNRLVLSLAQDFIHCATRGRKKIPKHLALPLAIKHMTGSTRVVTLLNRLGHGLSATQAA